MELIDSWEIDGPLEGLKFKVEIVRDNDTEPFEKVARPKTNPNEPTEYDYVPQECYDSEDIGAWCREEWIYVGTIVTPVYQDTAIPEAAASLWGTEWGSHWNADKRRCVDHALAPSSEGGYDLPGECMDNLKGDALDDAMIKQNLKMLNAQKRTDALVTLSDLLKAAK